MENNEYAYREGWISIIVNTLLFILKYWAGMVTGSVAIIADAWHTLSDSLTSIVVLVGAKISSKPADEEHPYGHGRAEVISSIIIAVLLAMVAGNFIVESIDKLRSHGKVIFGMPAIIATVISIIAKELLAQYAFYGGRKSGMQSLVADGWHHRSDAISSIIILIGIAIGSFFWWIDAAMGIIVSIIILYAAYNIIKESSSKIFGEKPDDNFIKKVEDLVMEIYKVESCLHHFHVHDYGCHQELTFHMRFPPYKTLKEVHDIIYMIETKLKEKMGVDVTIHPEPLKEISSAEK